MARASRARLDTTIPWHTLKFTETKTAGVVTGMEATCYHEDHRDEDQRCSRSLKFAAHGGPEMVERKLKWWAVAGAQNSIKSKRGHQELPKSGPNNDLALLPDLDSLEALAKDLLPHSALAVALGSSRSGRKRRTPAQGAGEEAAADGQAATRPKRGR